MRWGLETLLETQTRLTRAFLECHVLNHLPDKAHSAAAEIVVGRRPSVGAGDDDRDYFSIAVRIHEHVPWRPHRAGNGFVGGDYDGVLNLPIVGADLTKPSQHVLPQFLQLGGVRGEHC